MSRLTDHLLKLRQAIEQKGPETLAVFEPRRILPPPLYDTSRIIAPLLYTTAAQAQLDNPEEPTLRRTGLSIVNRILKADVPVYFVAEPFARAVAATQLPDDFTLADLHWPMPGFVVGFPLPFMREYCGLVSSYVLCADLPAGDHEPPPGLRHVLPTTSVPKAKAAFQFFDWSQEFDRMETYIGAYHIHDKVNEAVSNYAYLDYTGLDATGVKRAEQRLNLLVNLMFKLLMVLNTNRDLIESGSCTRPARMKHGRQRNALWSPTFIGRQYRVQREAPAGTHAGPSHPFWRRGHLRNQPHGPRSSLRKLIWVDPVLCCLYVDDRPANHNLAVPAKNLT